MAVETTKFAGEMFMSLLHCVIAMPTVVIALFLELIHNNSHPTISSIIYCSATIDNCSSYKCVQNCFLSTNIISLS